MVQGSQAEVPVRLEIIRAFVNTLDIEDERDELASADALNAWLVGRGLLSDGAPVSESDLRTALDLRESLRALMLANNGEELQPAVLDTLNRVSDLAAVSFSFGPDGSVSLSPAGPGVCGALGVMLGSVYAAMVDGTWARMKACRNDTCEWAFYDHSKNHSATWCSMESCGSRVKARNYRRRKAAAHRH